MVAIVIGMAVMAILLMAVAPSIATIMKGEREKELLFRGKQYARAIALFQRRYGRFPTQLKDLYESRPRTIRKLFKDPMCNCPNWQLIVQGSPDAILGNAPAPGRPVQLTPTPSAFAGAGETKKVGPIIGILAAIAVPALRDSPQRAREAALREDLFTLRSTIDQYHGDKGAYPPDLQTLVSAGYIRKIPLDPMTKSASTWVVAYEEPAPGGEPGAPPEQTTTPGVIDVHSGSPEKALDGTLYKDW